MYVFKAIDFKRKFQISKPKLQKKFQNSNFKFQKKSQNPGSKRKPKFQALKENLNLKLLNLQMVYAFVYFVFIIWFLELGIWNFGFCILKHGTSKYSVDRGIAKSRCRPG